MRKLKTELVPADLPWDPGLRIGLRLVSHCLRAKRILGLRAVFDSINDSLPGLGFISKHPGLGFRV